MSGSTHLRTVVEDAPVMYAVPMRYTFRPVDACDMCGAQAFKSLGMRLSASQGFRPRSAEGIAVPVKQCCECSLIFSDPQPVPEDLSDHYGLPPEQYWHPDRFQWSPDYFADEIATAKRLLDFQTGMTALDVGVGQGKAMKSLSVAGFDAWGLEPTEAFRRVAIESMGIEPDRVQLAPVETAEYPPAQFDLITFGAVLEHLYSPSSAIERALRWLKPRGIIQAEVPSSRWLIARIVNTWFRLAGTNYVTHLSPMHSPFHMFEFGLQSFQLNGKQLGYSIAEHHYMTCTVMHLPAKALFRRIMDATDTGMQLAVYLRRSI